MKELNKFKDAGWVVNMFSSVKGDNQWTLNARAPRSSGWISYAHPDLETLVNEFVNDYKDQL